MLVTTDGMMLVGHRPSAEPLKLEMADSGIVVGLHFEGFNSSSARMPIDSRLLGYFRHHPQVTSLKPFVAGVHPDQYVSIDEIDVVAVLTGDQHESLQLASGDELIALYAQPDGKIVRAFARVE